MHRARRPHLLLSWLTLLAMLVGVLAPTVSHAVQSRQAGFNWIEVCTAQGSAWVSRQDQPTGRNSSIPMSSAHMLEHCPYCALHAEGWAPPPSVWAVDFRPVVFEAPRLFWVAPRTLHAWLAAQPRAPPMDS